MKTSTTPLLDDTTENRPTSLSNLSEHDWQVLRHRWAAGANVARKVGRRWSVDDFVGKPWPHFRTRKAAVQAIDDLVCAESRHRAAIAALLPPTLDA